MNGLLDHYFATAKYGNPNMVRPGLSGFADKRSAAILKAGMVPNRKNPSGGVATEQPVLNQTPIVTGTPAMGNPISAPPRFLKSNPSTLTFFQQSPIVGRTMSRAARKAQLETDQSPFAPNALSDIWDDLKALAAPYVAGAGAKLKQQFQNQIDSAQTKLESQIGTFLTTGQTLVDLRARAEAQTGSPKPEVKARAVAIVAKTNALLNNYNTIKTDAMNQAQALVALKNQLNTSEVFKFDNPLGMGTRVVDLFNQYKSQLGKALTGSVTVGSRMAAHMQQTKDINNDVNSLESYAQGKGWDAALSSIGSSYLNLSGSLAKIALIGAGIYFLAPSFIGKFRKS